MSSAEREELRRLRRENARLRQEKEILRKAAAFFATLKKELIHRRSWPEREKLRREVFDYIEIFYNATRRHSTLGMLSPARYQEQNQSLQQLNDINNN